MHSTDVNSKVSFSHVYSLELHDNTPPINFNSAKISERASDQPFVFQEGMKQLKNIRHSLRGHDSEDRDSASAVAILKNMIGLFSNSFESLQKHIANGDKEKAAAELKLMVGEDVDSLMQETKELKELSKETKGLSGIGTVSKAFNDRTSFSGLSSIRDIPDSQLGDFLLAQPEVFHEMAEITSDFSSTLSEIDLSTLSKLSAKKDTELKATSHPKARGSQPFKKESATAFNKFGHFAKFSQDPSSFATKASASTVPDFQKQFKLSARSGISLPSLNVFLDPEQHEIVMVKHQQRQQDVGEQCFPNCQPNDITCNCDRLFQCVLKLDEYDLAVLNAGGFTDTTVGSENFGSFSVTADEVRDHSRNNSVIGI